MELYIIRHAQSTNNALTDLSERLPDPPLTDLGKRQAGFVAQHLANGRSLEAVKGSAVKGTNVHNRGGYAITRLYCSPMARALQTARPIGQALRLAPEVWIDIHEQGGVFSNNDRDKGGALINSGLTRSKILDEFPNYLVPAGVTEKGWWQGGCEEWSACYGRAIKVAQKLRQWANGDERVAIVSHGGFIDALLKALCDLLPGRHFRYHHHNTAITRVDFLAGGRLGLRYLNRIDHLPQN